MKLGFICKWGKEKEKTWSGTPYGLYKELGKIYDIFNEKMKQNVRGRQEQYLKEFHGKRWQSELPQ